MSSWPSKPLEELGIAVIDGDRGANYPKSHDFLDKGHCLFLSATNVTKSGFKFDECQFISEEKHNQLRKGHLQRGDIVVTTRGSVGNIAYYDESVPFDVVRLNSGMVILRNSGEFIETDYLYALLRSPWIKKQFDRMVFGSAQPQLTVGILNQLDLPSPKKSEQKKIAEILSAWDRAIEVSELQLRQSEAFLFSLLKTIFPTEKSSDFVEVKLADICEIIMGQSPDGSAYNESQEGLPLFQGNADIQNRVTSPRIWTTQTTKLCRIGDVLLSVRAPVGTVGKCLHEGVIGRGISALRGTSISSIELFLLMLRHEESWKRLEQGSTFTAVNSDDIKGFRVRLIKNESRRKIAADLANLAYEAVSIQEKALIQLKTQKQGLMQKLLTGRVRVKV